MKEPREWWINPETFIILDYESKYDDGMFNVIEKSEYDALKAELETLKRVVTPEGYKIQQVNYEQWENALVENERLKTELAEAKADADFLREEHAKDYALRAERNRELKTLSESYRDKYLKYESALNEIMTSNNFEYYDIARAVLGEKK